MTKEAQLLRPNEDRPDRLDEPGLAELLDPVALEARLQEARARRSAALSRRAAGAEPAPPEPPAPAAAPAPARPRRRGLVPGLLFALGLAVGGAGAALLAQPDLRRSLALLIAPEIAPEIAPPVAPAPPEAPAPPAPAAAVSPELAPKPPEVATEAPAAPAPAPLPEPVGATPAPEAAPLAIALAPPPLPAAPAADGAPPAPVADVPPPPALPARVILHFPASAEAEALAAREALLGLGVPEVETVPVRFAIGASNVRYYHAEDRDGAGRVAEAVAGSLAGGQPATRDFTDFRPPPLAGRVEIWIAGAPRAAAPRAARPAAPPAPPPPTPTAVPPAFPPADQAEAVARIIVERSLQRLLDQAPAR